MTVRNGGHLEKSGWAQRIMSVLKLEHNNVRKIFLTVVIILGGGYLLFAALFADTAEDIFGMESALKILAAAVLLILALLFETVAQLSKEPHLEVFEDEWDAEDRQKEIVASISPKWVKMCEYSAASPPVTSLLRMLLNSDQTRSIKLLVCHPSEIHANEKRSIDKEYENPNGKVREPHQVKRLLTNLAYLSDTVNQEIGLDEKDKIPKIPLRIRCYRQPASLRGRNFDNRYVAFGWYTYDRRSARQDTQQIWGAENPVIIASATDDYGVKLRKMYNGIFDRLWREAATLEVALREYEGDHSIDEYWLGAVSQLDEPDDPVKESTTPSLSEQPNGNAQRRATNRWSRSRVKQFMGRFGASGLRQ